MKRLFALGLPLFLTGCLLPPAFTIASATLSGFSYLATGKSLGDHALSQMAQQDCALHRIVTRGAPCDGPAAADPTLALAAGPEPLFDPSTLTEAPAAVPAAAVPAAAAPVAAEPVAAGPAPAALADRTPRPALYSSVEDAVPLWSPPGPPSRPSLEPRPAAPASAPDRRSAPTAAAASAAAASAAAPAPTMLVVGSFRVRARAERLVATHGDLQPTIIPATVRGERYYRVITTAPTATVSAAGIDDTWRLPLRWAAPDLDAP